MARLSSTVKALLDKYGKHSLSVLSILLVPMIAVAGTSIAYAYEFGYASYFAIPHNWVTVDIATLASIWFGLTIAIAMTSMAKVFDPSPDDPHSLLAVSASLTAIIFALNWWTETMIVMLVAFLSVFSLRWFRRMTRSSQANWHEYMKYLAIFLPAVVFSYLSFALSPFLCLATFVLPLAFAIRITEPAARWNHLFWLRFKSRINRSDLLPTFFLAALVAPIAVAWLIGYGSARTKQVYYGLEKFPTFALIRVYGDRFIFREVLKDVDGVWQTPRTKILGTAEMAEHTLVRQLHAKIGPLRLAKD